MAERLLIADSRRSESLVAPGAAQRKGLEGLQPAVDTRDVVVGHRDRRGTTTSRPRINAESSKSIRMGSVSHGRPRGQLFDIHRRSLAGRRVWFTDGGDHATLWRI